MGARITSGLRRVVLAAFISAGITFGLSSPGFSQAAGPGLLVEYTEFFYSPLYKNQLRHQRQFMYDAAGKVKAEVYSYYIGDSLVSRTRAAFNYDELGRLKARVSTTFQFKYFYNASGRIERFACYFLKGKEWEMLEETTIREERDGAGEVESLHLVMKKKMPGEIAFSIYNDLKYSLDAAGNIKRVQVNRFGNQPVNAVYSFVYDTFPNPLRHLYTERMYDRELENSGFNNLLTKIGSNQDQLVNYEYNLEGYPIRAQIGNKVIEYRYQQDVARH